MPKVLTLKNCAYLGADGHHVHLEADRAHDVPADVAEQLTFQANAARYLDADDRPDKLAKVGWVIASKADLTLAKNRRDYAARLARAD
jgi:hypothetical protein